MGPSQIIIACPSLHCKFPITVTSSVSFKGRLSSKYSLCLTLTRRLPPRRLAVCWTIQPLPPLIVIKLISSSFFLHRGIYCKLTVRWNIAWLKLRAKTISSRISAESSDSSPLSFLNKCFGTDGFWDGSTSKLNQGVVGAFLPCWKHTG